MSSLPLPSPFHHAPVPENSEKHASSALHDATRRRQVHKLGQVLEMLNSRDIQRGLRRHYAVFPGNELVQLLIDSGVAKDETDALAVGNGFLRKSFFGGGGGGRGRELGCLIGVLAGWPASQYG